MDSSSDLDKAKRKILYYFCQDLMTASKVASSVQTTVSLSGLADPIVDSSIQMSLDTILLNANYVIDIAKKLKEMYSSKELSTVEEEYNLLYKDYLEKVKELTEYHNEVSKFYTATNGASIKKENLN